jgi:aryl carrier-like protein
MVPTGYVLLDALPVTPNGKLDMAALPAVSEHLADPDPGAPAQADTTAAQQAPGSPAEIALAAIFEDLLGTTGVGVDSNFFALGGDSMMAITLIRRARQAGLAISPKEIVGNPTIGALAAVATPLPSPPTQTPPAEGHR